jgi:hypothetical protein
MEAPGEFCRQALLELVEREASHQRRFCVPPRAELVLRHILCCLLGCIGRVTRAGFAIEITSGCGAVDRSNDWRVSELGWDAGGGNLLEGCIILPSEHDRYSRHDEADDGDEKTEVTRQRAPILLNALSLREPAVLSATTWNINWIRVPHLRKVRCAASAHVRQNARFRRPRRCTLSKGFLRCRRLVTDWRTAYARLPLTKLFELRTNGVHHPRNHGSIIHVTKTYMHIRYHINGHQELQ